MYIECLRNAAQHTSWAFYRTVKINDLIVCIKYYRKGPKSTQDDYLHKPPAQLIKVALVLLIRARLHTY